MALSEKLYALRKKNGLSQEQLAEQLGVSRQAISKWESGTATPETEKLLAISNYFQVSLDYLVKENAKQEPSSAKELASDPPNRKTWLPGSIVCIGGILGLILWGLLSLFQPDLSEQIGQSSAIHIDGNGIFLLLSAAAVIGGAALLLKGTKK